MNRFLRLNKKLVWGLLLIFFLAVAIGTISRPAYGYIDDADKKPALNSEPVEFTPQVTIPGSSFQAGVTSPLEASTGPIARYISAIYNYGVGIVGILAALMLMIGGIIWLTAAGSSSKIEQAKSFIGSSLTGMALVLTAYILLNTINPDLVNLRTTTVTQLEELKCCQLSGAAVMTYPKECQKNNGQTKSLDYLVSADQKTCVKGGCCITSETPASFVGVVSTVFSSDMLSETKLTYKASLPGNCNTELNYPTATIILTAGLFGSQVTTIFTDASCTEAQDNTCVNQPDATTCLGKTRWGYCYSGKCFAGQGEAGDTCGTDPGSRCVKETAGHDCNSDSGGLGCVDDVWCCKGTVEMPSVASCSAASEGNSCKNGNDFGYCFQNTCLPCAKYGEACNTHDNSQCPDQDFNDQTNTTQQCGDDANDNNGDCSSFIWDDIGKPEGYYCDEGDD